MQITDTAETRFHWKCKHTWKQSAYNTMWCLIGCSIGDFGTIFFFQIFNIHWSTIAIILLNQMKISSALKTALGMSFISMIAMELTMNFTDWYLMGGAILVWWIVPIMLVVGFITPWPYNYWRLKKYDLACH